MKKLALLVFFVAATASAQHPITFDDLASLHRIGAPQLSPDGQWIAYDASMPELAKNYRHSAIFLVPAAGGESKKITDGVKQDEGPVWSPDGKTIAYVSNRDSAAKQLWFYDVASGASRRVTNLPGGAGSVKWLPNGQGVVLVSDVYPECGVDLDCTKSKTAAEESKPSKGRILTGLLYRHWTAWQEATRSHILLVMTGGGCGTDCRATQDLTPGTFDAPPFSVGGGDEFDVSPDGKELAYARNTDDHPEASTNADVFIYSLETHEAKRITSRKGADTSPKYSPDGKWISWRSQNRAGYESDLWELWVMDRATGQTRRLALDVDNWIEDVTWAPDSKSLFITAPEKSKTVIYEAPLTGRVTKVYGEGSSGALAVSKDGKTLYFDRSTISRPNDIFALKKGSAAATQLTHDNDALLRNITMGEASDIWYEGADGTPVQALLVKPPMFDATKKYPGVVLIHGGPQGAWGDGWSYRWNPQMFAARGYAILMPNPRGSVGYGQRFTEDISGDWRRRTAARRTCRRQSPRRGRRFLRRLHDRLDPRAQRPVQGARLARRRLQPFRDVRHHRGDLVPGVGVQGKSGGQPRALREVESGELREELQDADARGAQRARLPRPGLTRLRALHCAAAPRRAVEDALLPGRRPLGAEAAELEALARDGARLARPIPQIVLGAKC